MIKKLFLLILASGLGTEAIAAPKPAETIYRNGYIYTVDAQDSVQQALAVRGGRIVYVGDNAGAQKLAGKKTEVIDLQGRMLMPGLIDGHMHPQSGGSRLLNCSLNYESLTVAQFQQRIQACLDRDKKSGPERWMIVVNWFQQGMLPDGVETTAATLDALKTDRPIIVRSSFGHSALLNSKGIKTAKIERDTPDPSGGKITRDDKGNATGLLEDAAQDMAMNLLPPLTDAENLSATKAALAAMRQQGITSFLDAYTDPETMTAYTTLQKQGKLTARAHFAVLIDLDKGATPQSAVAELLKQQKQFDQGATKVAPSMQVRHAKLFMDGVISAPAFTGAMIEPYLVNKGTADKPDWQPGPSNGPASYFSAEALRTTLKELAHAHIDPHIHVDGDRAVRESLDAIADLRATPEGKRVRPALAHDEIVDPADYPRFAQLDVTPVLSFQWGKPAPDTLGALKDYMGPRRYALVEPQALLLNAGARIAYGSDWPVDPLDEWFALKVGVTRTAAPDAGKDYAGRLTEQPGMPRAAVLRAITLNAAYTLRSETQVGSLEVGKLADFIILDRNFFTIPAEDIANIKVLQTVVGGKIVYESKGMR
ncbi:amidohydrolase family protein [Duganella sp. FT80W]|uniref:Amidohydrolase family protein n=1 Tax=Duganella guangzhouensis TaxID=2666084 RepID=A0A6I2L574_9BURK|nr:amidohydrolase [Duganella guangzhouensis]MRW93321.1 amidohydrolase family protein [Duganella guangzhouensis]